MSELYEEYRERKIANGKKMGKGTHKRNPSKGTEAMSGPNKRQYMRKHWKKEVWDDIKITYENRTSYHWGKNSVVERHNVSVKTVDNMLKLIIGGVDWHTATSQELDL